MEHVQLLASSVKAATASYSLDQFGNPLKTKGAKGVKVVIDMTAVPGVATVTPKIEFKDPTSGKWITALTGAAIVAISTVALTVYPGITVTANVSAADVIPDEWRVTCTHSAGTDFTYSIGAWLIP